MSLHVVRQLHEAVLGFYLIAQRAFRRARAQVQHGHPEKRKWTNRKSKCDKRTSTKNDRTRHRKWHPQTENWPQQSRKLPQEPPEMVPSGAEEGSKSDSKPQDERRTAPRRSHSGFGPAIMAIRPLSILLRISYYS